MAGPVDDVIDSTAEELDVVPADRPAPANLFRTDDPSLVLARATEVANALKHVVVARKLFANIRGKNHVTVEGWQTLGAMLGVTAICEWTRPVENGWEARVVAQTLDGRTIGAAESMCLSTEGKPWNSAEEHARRSMAQTRATSKALASVLRFVITLAGYEGTPAEEMPNGGEQLATAKAEALAAYASIDGDRAKYPAGRFKSQLKSAKDKETIDKLVEKVREAMAK